MADYSPLTDSLFQKLYPIVCRAGKQIMDVYQDSNLDLEFKKDNSPVTKADFVSNQTIVKGIAALDLGFPIISEEGNLLDNINQATFWLIDPLDGTKDFIARTSDFCISIALISNRQPIFGLIYVPCTKQSYVAVANKGSFCIGANRLATKLAVKGNQIGPNQITRVGLSRFHINEATHSFLSSVEGTTEQVPIGSALKFCALASGDIDMYPRLGPTKEWDTAAGQLLVEEAGGSVYTLKTKEKLLYNKDELTNPAFIAVGWSV